jgi:DnaJ-class molecular chaperone
MPDYDRNRRWVAECGERLLTPRAVPSGDPSCGKCRTALGLVVASVPCEDCNGSGEARDLSGGICTACDGLGEVV